MVFVVFQGILQFFIYLVVVLVFSRHFHVFLSKRAFGGFRGFLGSFLGFHAFLLVFLVFHGNSVLWLFKVLVSFWLHDSCLALPAYARFILV